MPSKLGNPIFTATSPLDALARHDISIHSNTEETITTELFHYVWGSLRDATRMNTPDIAPVHSHA
jgi:hypothetical protein